MSWTLPVVNFNRAVNICVCVAEGTVSYDMPQGEKRNDVDLEDETYDGGLDSGFLSGGLGQLTDGEQGPSNFRLDRFSRGKKGYDWVGWRNESFPATGAVDIDFRFDAVRNFTAVQLHCNNMYTKDVRVFRLARITFRGGEGATSQLPPLEFQYARDTAMGYERTVSIPLENRIGREVRLRLYFDAAWMLISEVQFVSGMR